MGFSRLAVWLRLSDLPKQINWNQMTAVGALAGIGFTVSIFISSLAFDVPQHLLEAKASVLVASVLAGVGGYVALSAGQRRRSTPPDAALDS